ncbi:MAG: hypothetical protein RMJ43_11590 [Chloroherpetonaceae bacterium]|nr:hypothetical protein [Chthonomonadaceae bacterium]MDW8208472.1 hypothetical protein [Chloroherpetonaceae bacterium]
MFETYAPLRGSVARIALLAGAAVGGLIASRYFVARRINPGERLADALLDTTPLLEGRHHLSDTPEKALAACASYLIHVAYRATEALGVSGKSEDPVGYSRTHTHPYTQVTATVLTEATTPDLKYTYAVQIPDVGEVRGTRTVGSLRMSGLSPVRPITDVVQITLAEGYTAQIETEFEAADFLVTGRSRLFGAVTLRDNATNVGRINIAPDGCVTGTVTRDNRIVGRFEGQVSTGIHFRQNQIEGA